MKTHRLSNQIVNLRLWRPAAALMRRYRFPGKMSLISIAFVLPLAVLLYFHVSAQLEKLNFTQRQRQGIQYAQTTYAALQAAYQWTGQMRIAAAGTTPTTAESVPSSLDKALKELQTELPVEDSTRHTRAALEQLQANTRQASPNPDALTQSLTALLDQIRDESGLTLDPDMGSYHLMDALLICGPQIISHTAELRDLGLTAYSSPSPDILARMLGQAATLKHELGLAAEALSQTRAIDTARASMLNNGAQEDTNAFLTIAASNFQLQNTEVHGDKQAYSAAASRALEAQFQQVHQHLNVLDAMLQDREADLRLHLWQGLAVVAAGLLLAFYLFMGFFRAMSGGFKALRRNLIGISMGDLRTEIQGTGHDEVAGLLRELQNMQSALRETVGEVQSASDTVVQSSIEIAHGSSDLSARTEAAAAALEQSSASLEQTSATIKMTAHSVEEATRIAQDNASSAVRGGQVMRDVITTMERIQSSSKKVNDIISVIDSIAFQTNLLALNAAVEAARAGEQGRGFAVVAGEVRALAGRSAEAAKEIKALISDSTQEVTSGVEVVRHAGETMQDIVTNAEQVKTLLDEVATGAREQSAAIHQIGLAINELDQTTQANAALVEEVTAAATSQRGAAVRMAAQVDEFRLPGKRTSVLVEGIDVDTIIDAHRQWKTKLRDAIENGDAVDTQTLSRDDCCALGKWIYGDGQRLSQRPSFVELVGKHAHFHRIAGEVGGLINRGAYTEAEDALAPGTAFSRATTDVVMVLSSAKRMGF